METAASQEQPTKMSLSLDMASAMLAQRCREDREFAAALRAKPREVLQEMLHQQGLDEISLPKNIVLWENTSEQWHLTVPNEEVAQQTESLAHQPLSDEVLEEVQGGFVLTIFGSTLAVSVVGGYLGVVLGGGSLGGIVGGAALAGGAAAAAVGAGVGLAAVAGATGATVGALAATGKI